VEQEKDEAGDAEHDGEGVGEPAGKEPEHAVVTILPSYPLVGDGRGQSSRWAAPVGARRSHRLLGIAAR
jgi:hypothetical protein